MNATEFAAKISGREYSSYTITKSDAAEARDAGLVIVYGASDDLMEFNGAIEDELGAYDGTTARVTPMGILPSWESLEGPSEAEAEAYFLKKHAGFKTIEACWASEGDYSWTFKTDIPHATFEIVEGGEPYCRGIVFSLADAA